MMLKLLTEQFNEKKEKKKKKSKQLIELKICSTLQFEFSLHNFESFSNKLITVKLLLLLKFVEIARIRRISFLFRSGIMVGMVQVCDDYTQKTVKQSDIWGRYFCYIFFLSDICNKIQHSPLYGIACTNTTSITNIDRMQSFLLKINEAISSCYSHTQIRYKITQFSDIP